MDEKTKAKMKAKSGMGFTNIPRSMIDEIKQKKKAEEKLKAEEQLKRE